MQKIIFWLAFCIGIIIPLSLILFIFIIAIKNCIHSASVRFNWSKVIDYLKNTFRPFDDNISIYLSGIVIWILMSIAIFTFLGLYVHNKDHVAYFGWFILPFIGLIITLIWNGWLNLNEINNNEIVTEGSDYKRKNGHENDRYDKEVELIQFVERHANYLIYGITGVFIATQFWMQSRPQTNFVITYFFMGLSMLLAVCGVLPLIWIKKGEARHLEWLRHFKTIWYSYSIYLFFAGIIALAIAIIK